jgi:glycosyltransferase involved in cell wall biosynthesis
MWRQVLRGLDEFVELEERERAPRLGRAPDVWLADGHTPPPHTRGAPLVVQVHEASWSDAGLEQFLGAEFATAMAASTESSMLAASHVITPSEASRQQVTAAYSVPPERIHAIHHGVDLDLFHPGRIGGRDLVGDPYVLFVGVIHPRKNLDALREAMSSLGRRAYKQALAVVGSPAADRRDPTAFAEAGYADLPDATLVRIESPTDEQLAGLMAEADAFCLPSWFEGFGLPALEAMACGTPVIVSDRGALPEVVGDGGLVVEPTAEAVEAALRRVLSDAELSRSLGAAGRARAEQMPWSRTVEGWLAVIERAAAGD